MPKNPKKTAATSAQNASAADSSRRYDFAVESWPIDRIRPYEHNPRRHDHVIHKMAAAIREFGFKIPILVRSDGELVDGHLRVKAAKSIGMTELPAVLCDEWSEEQVKAFRLMVNKSSEWAEWDFEKLDIELQDLKGAEDFNFDLMELGGFKLAQQGEADEEEEQEPQSTKAPRKEDGAPVIQYNVIFEDELQQARWFEFLGWLKRRYPEGATIASRIHAFLGSKQAAFAESE